jgi:predicted Fe-Mo cluster-binding NifX family protein
MKIAIPLFHERVSPYFGSSSRLLLVNTHGENLWQEVIWDVGGEDPMEIARHLVDLGVEIIMCGGIPHFYKEWLARKGVTVMDNKKGIARQVIQKFLTEHKDIFPGKVL